MRVNIYYCYLDPKDEHVDTFKGHSFIHSREPVPACDIYAALNICSFKGRQPRARNILIMEEPEVVEPNQYRADVWQMFDHIFTAHSALVRQMPRGMATYFYTWRGAGYPSIITEPLNMREIKYPIGRRRNAIVMIAGNKRSPMPSEIYHMRKEAADWFHKPDVMPFDLFGTPPFSLPNFRGAVAPGPEARIAKLAEYRYALTFENSNHPIWGKGYHQKMPDPLEARTVPIYYGCPDIEKYVPQECFIDFRDFHLSYQKLNEYLVNLSEEEYLCYVRNIDDFVSKGGLRPWQWSDIFQKIIDWAQPQDSVADFETNGEKEVVAEYITLRSIFNPGMVVFDVGAHVGEWASLLPEGVNLYSFEPDAGSFSVLPVANTGRGGKFQLALSDKEGEHPFYQTSLSMYNLLNRPEMETSVPVKTMTLDDFCTEHKIEHIDFMKIDVEGGEFAVLEGAYWMLENGNIDTIQFEYGPCYQAAKTTLQETVKYLETFGYTISRIEKDGLVGMDGIREDYRYANYLAVRRTKMEDKKKDTIVVAFSKDRAMQLDALIRSFKEYCSDQEADFDGHFFPYDFAVLYATSSQQFEEQYRSLMLENMSISWVHESDFQADLLRIVEGYKYVIFLTDDTMFVRPFSIEEAKRQLEYEDTIGFSFRLGNNTTYCYMHDKHFVRPFMVIRKSVETMTWSWVDAQDREDFGYPLELSSSMYRLEDIRPYLMEPTYSNPNTLEAWLDYSKNQFQRGSYPRPMLASYATSVAFSNPINMVQTTFTGNRKGTKKEYSVEKLAELFDEGWRVNLEPLNDMKQNGVHQVVDLEFKNDKGEIFIPEKELEVSICIGNWNGQDRIEWCINSIARTTAGHDIEILVWDNGSTDGSLEFLRELEKLGRIRLYESTENLGGAMPKIKLLPLCKARYVAFVDNDVCLPKGWLEECQKWAQNIPDLGMVGARSNYSSGVQGVNEPLKYFSTKSTIDVEGFEAFAAKWAADPTHQGQLWQVPRIVGFFWFLTPAAIERVGNLKKFGMFGFDDDDYSLRVQLSGLRPIVDNGLYVHHFGGKQGQGDPEYNGWMLQAWTEFKQEWGLPEDLKYGETDHITTILSRTTFDPAKHYVPLEKT